jgi:hypothetical protein
LDVEHVHVLLLLDQAEAGGAAVLVKLDLRTLIQIRYLTHPLLEH